jgi:hypothetical protein
MEIVSQPEALGRFKEAIAASITTVVESVEKLKDVDPNILNSRMDALTRFSDSVAKMSSITQVANSLVEMIKMLSEEDRWRMISKNLDKMSSSMQKVVDTINKINILKSKALSDNLKLLSEAKSQKDLVEVLKKLLDLITKIDENGGKNINLPTTQTSSPFPFGVGNTGNTSSGGGFKSTSSQTSSGNYTAELTEIKSLIQSSITGNAENVERIVTMIDKISRSVYTVKVEKNANDIHSH